MTEEERDKEYNRLRARVYYQENREKLLARSKARYHQHKAECAATTKAWRERNPDKVIAQNRTYYQEHKDELKAKRIAKQQMI